MLSFFKRAKPEPASVVSAEPVDVEALVTLAYHAVLRRRPDATGLAVYARALREGHDLAWLIEQLSSCDEYDNLTTSTGPDAFDGYWFDRAPPMQVDPRCTPEELAALWQHVASVWSGLGETDAHWSVLTQDRYRADALGAAELAEFYESGEAEVERLNIWLRRAGLEPRPDGVCAEYGCGVGRITHSLARRNGRVIGFDVSEPHLRAAREHMVAAGIDNVGFVRVAAAADLQALSGLDAFFSVISLQHSPPPIILDVLGHAFAGLNPGGYAFFQVPSYSRNYTYSASTHLAGLRSRDFVPEMEMHFVPQHAIFDLAHRVGLTVIEVEPDGCIGGQGHLLSTTYLLARS